MLVTESGTTTETQEKQDGEKADAAANCIGLDIGTTNIVVMYDKGGRTESRSERNAFFTVPSLPTTKKILSRKDIIYFEKEDQIFVLGNSAEDLAGLLGGVTRKTIEKGIVNLKEEEVMTIIGKILNSILPPGRHSSCKVYFSIPGMPLGSQSSINFNDQIFRTYLSDSGYEPESINEGLAVILSELSGNNATGIGISMGGGMCNVCLSYLSIPVLDFSIQKGGDYIDEMVADTVGESIANAKRYKEDELDLSIPPENSLATGLRIYYQDLFGSLIKSLKNAFALAENIPRFSKPIPMVLSGGTMAPRGTLGLFKHMLEVERLPIKISEVRQAQDPLLSTARGAMIMAVTGEEQ